MSMERDSRSSFVDSAHPASTAFSEISQRFRPYLFTSDQRYRFRFSLLIPSSSSEKFPLPTGKEICYSGLCVPGTLYEYIRIYLTPHRLRSRHCETDIS